MLCAPQAGELPRLYTRRVAGQSSNFQYRQAVLVRSMHKGLTLLQLKEGLWLLIIARVTFGYSGPTFSPDSSCFGLWSLVSFLFPCFLARSHTA